MGISLSRQNAGQHHKQKDFVILSFSTIKLLGLTISNNLKWNAHIENVIKKGASRLYLLRQLKSAKGDPAQLLCFYTTCIRPMSEYACQVFHNGLPVYLSEELILVL